MSYGWWFYSYSVEKLHHYFGHASPEEAEEMVEAATWDVRTYGDPAPMERAARHLATVGPSYTGLSAVEAQTLDECIPELFGPEGVAEQLEVTPESPDLVHPNISEELLKRAEGRLELRALPVLRNGWRYAAGDLTAKCNYVLLHPDHLEPLAQEISNVVALPLPWSDDYVPKVVEDCLLGVMRTVIPKRKGLAGFLT